MNNTYNSNLYLTTKDLNDIEDRIEELTEECQEKIFSGETENSLKNIEVNDSLNSKTLYCFFPRNLYESMTGENTIIIQTDKGNTIRFYKHTYSSYNRLMIEIVYDNSIYTLYRKDTNKDYISYNIKRFKIPYDFGIVTNIETGNDFYEYIKIYDDENIIPSYEKHIWNDDEVLSMQKIDNIEHGIENIGYYYYKPNGWINGEEWLKTSNVESQDTNTNIKNISFRDLNRWINNLYLISFDDIQNLSLWNSDISNIEWNIDSNVEWEEF